MTDLPTRIFKLRFIYLAIITLFLFLHTLPNQTNFDFIFLPDMMLSLTFVWIVRRPDIIGPILLTLTFLFADILLQRPPALWSLIVLCIGMFLRARAIEFQESFFIYEWATAAGLIICCYTLQYIAMRITAIPVYDPGLIVIQTASAIILYPIFVWLFRPLLKRKILDN